jgi:chemotaxis signal transduction protein
LSIQCPTASTSPTEKIQPVPQFAAALSSAHITGIGTLGQGQHESLLILMDVEQLLLQTVTGLSH